MVWSSLDMKRIWRTGIYCLVLDRHVDGRWFVEVERHDIFGKFLGAHVFDCKDRADALKVWDEQAIYCLEETERD